MAANPFRRHVFFHPPNMEIVSSERLRFCHVDKVITDCGPNWKIRAFAQEIPKQTFGSVLYKRESNWKFSGQRLRWPDNNTGTLGLLSLVFCLYLLSMCFIKHLFSCLETLDRLQICRGGFKSNYTEMSWPLKPVDADFALTLSIVFSLQNVETLNATVHPSEKKTLLPH